MSELAQDTGPPSGTTIAAERIYDIHTTYPLHLTTVRTYTLKLPYGITQMSHDPRMI